jgi:hypothetical protein
LSIVSFIPFSFILNSIQNTGTIAAMSRSMKIVGSFALVGFLLPLVLLGYSVTTGAAFGSLQASVCPSIMMCMGLDQASTSTGIFVWLIIALSNAFLYALPGLAFAFVLKLLKPDPSPESFIPPHKS